MKRNVGCSVSAVLWCAAAVCAQAPDFTPYRASGIYELGEKAGWKATLPVGGTPATYRYTIRKNNAVEIGGGALDFSKGFATIEAAVDEPAMVYVEAMEENASKSMPVHLGAAVAPEKIKPSVGRPADFDSFWEGKVKALREVPVNPVLTPAESNKARVELYTVMLDSAGSHV